MQLPEVDGYHFVCTVDDYRERIRFAVLRNDTFKHMGIGHGTLHCAHGVCFAFHVTGPISTVSTDCSL